jgi:prophage regulatory protein
MSNTPHVLLRLPEVLQMTGLGRSQAYALVKAKRFPPPIKLSERSSAWVESEVSAWVAERIAASRSISSAA